ncbi:hypothetical protein ACFPQ7_19565, partial [Methylobacterium iners]|uniref:hypothetical protein n=1 Tax=Methylobacterium iners TaxID=418707 RepID=UPI00361C4A9C
MAKQLTSSVRPIIAPRLVHERGRKTFYAAANDKSTTANQTPSSLSNLTFVAEPTPMAVSASAVSGKAGNGCVANFRSTVRDRVVGPAFANGCYRAIESAPGANAERLTIRGLRGRDLLR